MMNEREQADCKALAKAIADFAAENAAGLDEAIVFNACVSAGCAYAASNGRTPAEVRAVLHRLGDGLLLAGASSRSGAN